LLASIWIERDSRVVGVSFLVGKQKRAASGVAEAAKAKRHKI